MVSKTNNQANLGVAPSTYNNFEFSMLPSEFLQLSLRAGPTGTLSSCKILSEDDKQPREVVLINSGESVLIFDLSITLTRGTSGLIKILSLH